MRFGHAAWFSMDLNTITALSRPHSRDEVPHWSPGMAWLGGGTWLFSEPQPHLTHLVDVAAFRWAPVTIDDAGLTLAATCTIAQLHRAPLPPGWTAAPLVAQCCEALLASFKVWNTATIGGNLCLALPAGAMIALTAALDGRCTLWRADGREETIGVLDLIVDAERTCLAPGDLLRSIFLPRDALTRRTALRKISLHPLGRSAALLIGTVSANDRFVLTITGSTRRPVQLAFDTPPTADALAATLAAAVPDGLYYDDIHGRPDWRRAVTALLAEEIRAELGGALGSVAP